MRPPNEYRRRRPPRQFFYAITGIKFLHFRAYLLFALLATHLGQLPPQVPSVCFCPKECRMGGSARRMNDCSTCNSPSPNRMQIYPFEAHQLGIRSVYLHCANLLSYSSESATGPGKGAVLTQPYTFFKCYAVNVLTGCKKESSYEVDEKEVNNGSLRRGWWTRPLQPPGLRW